MKVLFLSPHTDDVELGCGGSLAKFIEEGNEIKWAVFSTAEESLPKNFSPDTLREEFNNVLKSYGLGADDSIIFQNPVRKLSDHRQEILENMVKIRRDFEPDLVIGPSLNDYHQDHQVVANEMIRAFKTTSGIICYELPWNHVTFNSQLFVKLTKSHIDKKIEALNNYESQIFIGKEYFKKEFVYGIAKMRGVQCGSEFAEAFEVIRWRM